MHSEELSCVLIGIFIIHAIEHFELFQVPGHPIFDFSTPDAIVFKWTFTLISGKAYSLFAIMFGVSFIIQTYHEQLFDKTSMLKYVWRLCILFIFGFVNSLFYRGDILHMYALLALPLLFLVYLPTKAQWIVFTVLILLVPFWLQIFFTENKNVWLPIDRNLDADATQIYTKGSMWDVIQFNLTKGRLIVWSWCINTGKIFQIIALFVLGMILGRSGFFQKINTKQATLLKFIVATAIILTLIYFLQKPILRKIPVIKSHYLIGKTIFVSYYAFLYTIITYCTLSWVYLKTSNSKIWITLANLGKMNLSNYVINAIVGVILFYGFGFGLYDYLGSTITLAFAFNTIALHLLFSHYWLKHYQQGPLEYVWKMLTEWNFRLKNKM
jgi:uncharacterized protein